MEACQEEWRQARRNEGMPGGWRHLGRRMQESWDDGGGQGGWRQAGRIKAGRNDGGRPGGLRQGKRMGQ
jgi:hypothetical protein